MLFKTVFRNQINIYWTEDNPSSNTYTFLLNGNVVGSSSSTYFSFVALKPNTIYEIKVFLNNEMLYQEEIRTKNNIEINVKDFIGNIENNEVLTGKLQKVIDNAESGSIIKFPKGVYLTGALFINKPLEIYLEKDAVIQGSNNPVDYLPMSITRFEGMNVKTYSSLFNIGTFDLSGNISLSNIVIRGEGAIYGGGNQLAENIFNYETNIYKNNNQEPDIISIWRKRGRLIHVANARNVVVDGLALGLSPSWNLHIIYCSDITVSNCRFNSYSIHNGDGIDIDSSRNCDIYNCLFDVGDDCIALKSGKYNNEKVSFIPTENVNIFYCRSLRGHGIAIGSEVSGGIKNINVFNCDFVKSLFGMHIKTTSKRGGYVRKVNVKKCKFSTINMESNVDYNNDGDSSSTLTDFSYFYFRDIYISGITYDSPTAQDYCNHIIVDGFKNDNTKFNNMKFENITLNIHPESKFEDTVINNVSNAVLVNIEKKVK